MSTQIEPQSSSTVIITDGVAQVFVQDGVTQVVEVVTPGPQGPVAPPFNLGDLPNVKVASAVNKSLLYYDSSSAEWRGDAIHTVITLTDGGGF